MHIELNGYGAGEVDQDDRDRALAAAQEVIDRSGMYAEECFPEYRFWIEDTDGVGTPDAIKARTWIAAQDAATEALTRGWANPGGVYCTLVA